jgi:DNA-binding NarL/FixJ family response regulator
MAASPEKAPPERFGVTPRELEITSAVVAGFSNKEIAKKFSLSQDTVKHHLTNIFDKVGASNRLELALFAVHHRLLEDEPATPAASG